MKYETIEDIFHTLLSKIDVRINGSRPWDIRVNNDRLFQRIAAGGSLAFGEAYMDGWWDCEQLDELMSRIIKADLGSGVRRGVNLPLILRTLLTIRPAGLRSRAFKVGEHHYDTGNDLFQLMLDKRLVYTCGYWKNAATLDEAQEAKLELVCKKIGLKPGMKVLDIGGGWGSLAKYMAERYGASVVNVTVSKEQVALANKLCKGLPVENRLQDYRDVNEKFDAIVSLGMFEHVGPKFYKTYMMVVDRCLAQNGLFLLHTIGRTKTGGRPEPWIAKYIFPNSALPSAKQIMSAAEEGFILEDWHNFGADYDKTLLAWYANFEREWPRLQTKYGDRFYRMWRYYLLACAGAFRARNIQLWQIVLSKNGVPGGYQSIR